MCVIEVPWLEAGSLWLADGGSLTMSSLNRCGSDLALTLLVVVSS